MDEQRQDDQLEPTYNSSALIQDVALKTYRKWWMIGWRKRVREICAGGATGWWLRGQTAIVKKQTSGLGGFRFLLNFGEHEQWNYNCDWDLHCEQNWNYIWNLYHKHYWTQHCTDENPYTHIALMKNHTLTKWGSTVSMLLTQWPIYTQSLSTLYLWI